MTTCAPLVQNASTGVAAALHSVDCMAGTAAQSAFARLFGSGGALLPALTLLLTLYIAAFAIGLLTGRTRLGVAALTPRMLLVGVVLTFATSWVAYQSVIWTLAIGAPDQVAGLVLGSRGQASQIFAARIDILFQAIADAAEMAGQQQGAAAAPAAASSAFAPSSLVWLAAVLLLLGTVGVLVTTRIMLAVLLTTGPVFLVLALFRGTRGLAAGWLRALVLIAVAPLLATLCGALTIELAVPVVQRLSGPEGIEPQPAFALFLIAAVHCALMIVASRVSATMVAGWRVFGLVPARANGDATAAPPASASRPAGLPTASPRQMAVGAVRHASGAAQHTARSPAAGAAMPRLGGTIQPLRTQAITGSPARGRGLGSQWRRAASPGAILR